MLILFLAVFTDFDSVVKKKKKQQKDFFFFGTVVYSSCWSLFVFVNIY